MKILKNGMVFLLICALLLVGLPATTSEVMAQSKTGYITVGKNVYYVEKEATTAKAGTVILMQCKTEKGKVVVNKSVTYEKLKYTVTGIAGTYNGKKKASSVFKKGVTDVVLPSSLTLIGTNSFHGCSKIKSLSIPKGVKTIEQNAINDCKKLSKITINNTNIKFPKAKAFAKISKNATIYIPVGDSVDNTFQLKVKKQVSKDASVLYNISKPVIKFISNGKNTTSVDTSEEKVSISGIIFSNKQIKKTSFTVADGDGKTIDKGTVKSGKEFRFSCKAGIGTNTLSLSTTDSKGKKGTEKLNIIRQSTEVEYNDNVTIESYNSIADVMDSIINTEVPTQNTTEMTFSNDSKVVTDINKGTLKKGDVYIIDSSPACPMGFSGVIENIESKNGTTVVRFRQAEISDIYKGDVCIKSSGTVDAKDPIAFTYFPITDQGVSLVSDGRNSIKSLSMEASVEKDGLKFDCVPSEDGVSASLSFEDFIIYDKDGNEDTTYDQVVVSGSYSINDIKQDTFLDKQGLTIKQYYNKLSYTTEKDISLKAALSLDLKELVKKFNNGFDNTKVYNLGFAKFNLEGVDTSDSIFLGAAGFHIVTKKPVTGVGTAVIEESDRSIDPIAFVAFILHLDGSISTEVSLGYNETEYCAKGVNLTKDNYTNGMPAFDEKGDGVETYDLGGYTLQVINASCSDKELLHKGTDRNIYLSGKGEAQCSFGAGLMSGLLLDGIIPAAVNVYGYIGAAGSVEGAVKYSLTTKTIQPDSDGCKVSINVDSGFAGRVQIKLNDIIDVTMALKISKSVTLLEYPKKDTPTGIVNPQNNHTYSIVNLPMTWTEAKAYCESLGGHLATITSEGEQRFIVEQLNNYGTTKLNYWLGATDVEKEGTWVWLTGEAFEYSNWDRGEPNNARGGTEHYLGLYYDDSRKGVWNDFKESADVDRTLDTFGFLCEWDNGSTDKAEVVDNTNKYLVINESMTWTEAKVYCEGKGGHLVTITSAEEQQYITDLLNSSGTKTNYWLGATDQLSEGTWTWVTGEEFIYGNWDKGEPNNDRGGAENYLGMYFYGSGKGRWNDFCINADSSNPLNTFGFICEWD